VYGTVIDAQTKEPLAFASVQFKGTKTGITTDLEGKYSLETYYASDSLQVTFFGYKTQVKRIKKDIEQRVDFALEVEGEIMEEVIIKADKKAENPAHVIFRKVVENKPINNKAKLDSYEYEVYNKVQFDLNNIKEKFTNRKVFKKFNFIFDNIDSSETEKPHLPVLITESISDFYYRSSPKASKEVIKASRVSGVNNESLSQFMGQMYQQGNIYNDRLEVFGKFFVSPFSDHGLNHYKYYLEDSATIDGYWCYKLIFMPKRKQELTFEGEVWIHDTTYAIKEITGYISEDANINFVKQLVVKQTFEQVESEVWMPIKDELFVELNITEKQMGFYGRKSTSYKNFVINKPKEGGFYSADNIVVLADALTKNNSYWEGHRHDSLTDKQKNIYRMIDTLENLPIVHTYIDVIQTIFTGYKVIGPVELGPYFSTYSFNVVEGHRFRLGGRTSNDFSKKIEFSGYGAYGLTDEKFKYGFGSRINLSREPRRMLHLVYKNDVEQLGLSQNAFRSDDILSSFLRRNPYNKLTFAEEYRIAYENEWFAGLSSTFLVRNVALRPLGIIPFQKTEADGSITAIPNVTTTEVTFYTRFANKEQFLRGEFERISLGTKNPIMELQFTQGFKNVLGSQYNYQKIVFGYKHKFSLGIFGLFRYRFEAGKIFGTVPYPLLEIHAGNETFTTNPSSFNMMNLVEFISDQYVSANFAHHFEGLFLNKIPLLRRLKWREVATFKAVYGTLNSRHLELMDLPTFSRSLQAKPYMECSVGVENIFKILRVDLLWRLTYLDNTFDGIDVSTLALRFNLSFDF
jgi:hypothetical protein